MLRQLALLILFEIFSQAQTLDNSVGIHGNIEPHPYMVQVHRMHSTNPSGLQFMCTGILYSAHLILTTASCLDNDNETEVIIVAGDTQNAEFASPSSSRQKHEAAQYIIHENYNSTTLENDIALIRVTESFLLTDNVKVLQFERTNSTVAEMGFITGWEPNDISFKSNKVLVTSLQITQNINEEEFVLACVAPYTQNVSSLSEYTARDILWTYSDDKYTALLGIKTRSFQCRFGMTYTMIFPFSTWLRTTRYDNGFDFYRCKNGEETPMFLVCDGGQDCKDLSDESGCEMCPLENTLCEGDESCSKEMKYICHGSRPNVGPVSHFSTKCIDDFLMCSDNSCIPRNFSCNGQLDCADGSDEFGCFPCSINEFECARESVCINKTAVCDFKSDCKDSTDEIGCEKLRCKNSIVVNAVDICDNLEDCLDELNGTGSDEMGCNTTLQTSFDEEKNLTPLKNRYIYQIVSKFAKVALELDPQNLKSGASIRSSVLFPELTASKISEWWMICKNENSNSWTIRSALKVGYDNFVLAMHGLSNKAYINYVDLSRNQNWIIEEVTSSDVEICYTITNVKSEMALMLVKYNDDYQVELAAKNSSNSQQLWKFKLLLAPPVEQGNVYFEEDFSKKPNSRWKQSEIAAGNFTWNPALENIRIIYSSRIFSISTKFPSYSSMNDTFVLQYSARIPQNFNCGGNYIQLFDCNVNSKYLSTDSLYLLSFGPTFNCKNTFQNFQFHIYVKVGGVEELVSLDQEQIPWRNDGEHHVFTLIIYPDELNRFIIMDNEIIIKQGSCKAYIPTFNLWESICGVGFNFYHHTDGTSFDNILLTNDETYASNKRSRILRPLKDTATKISERARGLSAGAVILISLIFISVSICILGILWHRRRALLLQKRIRPTEAEIQEFLEGVSFLVNHDEADTEANARCSPYNITYELALSDMFIDKERVLGEGAFGIVYEGKVQKNGRFKKVAFKTTKSSAVAKDVMNLLSELKLMIYVDQQHHPNIVHLIGASTEKLKEGIVYVATELCQMGSLLKYLRRSVIVELTFPNSQNQELDGQKFKVTTAQLGSWALEISRGMNYLSQKLVIHSDLAARNVLLTSEMTAKISDFGLSRRLQDYEKYTKKSKGPLPWQWMAYESLASMTFSTKSDVWSFGVTLWEIYTLGSNPYVGLSWNTEFLQMLKSGIRLPKPDHGNLEIYDKILACWNIDSTKRPTFQFLENYFQQFSSTVYLESLQNL